VSGTMIFIIVIIAIVTVGRIVRVGMELEARKNGFTLGGKRGRRGRVDDRMAADSALTQENEMLRGKVKGLEERMAVLERIATDAPTRLTAEIEKLRD
jgi:hypothetical protein